MLARVQLVLGVMMMMMMMVMVMVMVMVTMMALLRVQWLRCRLLFSNLMFLTGSEHLRGLLVFR